MSASSGSASDVGRVLVIAYAFPPCGGAGVQRVAKFVRYLPEFGWRPTVLTVVPSCYAVRDDSHVAELPPEVEVVRTPHYDPVVRPAAQGGSGGEVPRNPGRGAWWRALRSLARGAWRLVDHGLLIPDRAILWCPRAILAGWRIHRRRGFDLILATGEPYSDYLTALALGRLTGAPFLIDMRDPWTFSSYRPGRSSAWRGFIERWQERRVLARSRACVFSNHSMLDEYAKAFPQWAHKMHCIPNGYDPADFAGVPEQRFEKLTIVHNGTFLPGYRTADTFLLALRRLLDEEPRLPERLQVFLVGRRGGEADLIERLGLGHVVRQPGYLPHRESLGYLKGADVLLLVGGDSATEETGKIYEYFAAAKPILALVVEDGAAARQLRAHPSRWIVPRDDVEGTRAALREIATRLRPGAPPLDTAWSRGRERRRLTQDLARLLDSYKRVSA